MHIFERGKKDNEAVEESVERSVFKALVRWPIKHFLALVLFLLLSLKLLGPLYVISLIPLTLEDPYLNTIYNPLSTGTV